MSCTIRAALKLGRPACVVGLMLGACGAESTASVPPGEVYPNAVSFAGEWIGEVGGTMGSLSIKELGAQRYRGQFDSDDAAVNYVLSLERSLVAPAQGGSPAPSNLVLFTWQDGRGGRGVGWLMVNREDSALTGQSVYGEGAVGGGVVWQLIRVE